MVTNEIQELFDKHTDELTYTDNTMRVMNEDAFANAINQAELEWYKKLDKDLCDRFLLLENRGINLSHVREIVIAPITEQYSVLRKWIPIQIGYQILIIYKENVHIVYKEYKLSKAYTDELTNYFKGASEQYPINVKPIIGNALKQLETVVNDEFKTLFNTIRR